MAKKQPVVADQWAEIKHFKPADFACKCGGSCNDGVAISMTLVKTLDAIADEIKLPIRVNSGTRCARYNVQVVRASPTSPHVPDPTGKSCAVDVASPNAEFAYKLVAAALSRGIQHVGIGAGFVHLDCSARPEGVKLWAYPTNRRNR